MIAYSAPSASPAIRISNDPSLFFSSCGHAPPGTHACDRAPIIGKSGNSRQGVPASCIRVGLRGRFESRGSLDLAHKGPVATGDLVHAPDLVGGVADVVERRAGGGAAVTDDAHGRHDDRPPGRQLARELM